MFCPYLGNIKFISVKDNKLTPRVKSEKLFQTTVECVYVPQYHNICFSQFLFLLLIRTAGARSRSSSPPGGAVEAAAAF